MVARSYDAIVVGGGHNGLVTTALLARAGLRTLVLERRDSFGGAAATTELAPGVRVPTVAHTVGRLSHSIVEDLDLRAHGLQLITPEVRVFAPQRDGGPLTLWASAARTAAELESSTPKDAAAYEGFDRRVRALAAFLAHLHRSAPPDLAGPSLSDALEALRVGRAYRGLSEDDGRALLRVLPMAAADFVRESFEDDRMNGLMCARAVRYAAAGPWSAGTALGLLSDAAGNDGGAAGETVFARGGPGAVSSALLSAARAAGADARAGAEVAQAIYRDGRVAGVVLASGEEIEARAVVSGMDPKRTLETLIDPVIVGPTFMWRCKNIRTPGVVAKVNLALAELPRFTALNGDGGERLRGRIVIAGGIDDVEGAFDATKYGRMAESPCLEATIPSLSDPTLVDGDGHVMSVVVQYAPYRLREGNWDDKRDALGDRVVAMLEEHTPGLGSLVTARQVLTPLDLERDFGLTEGHPLHGDPGLDQFYAWRPLLGHARYRFGAPGLYLCGSGAHPGGGVTGQPGANAARVVLADLKRSAR